MAPVESRWSTRARNTKAALDWRSRFARFTYGALIIVGLWIVVALSDRLGWPTGGWKVLFLWLALCATMLAITRLWWNIRGEERWQLLRTMVSWNYGVAHRSLPPDQEPQWQRQRRIKREAGPMP